MFRKGTPDFSLPLDILGIRRGAGDVFALLGCFAAQRFRRAKTSTINLLSVSRQISTIRFINTLRTNT
jgi:hypothetical protein